ncbi:MAG: ribosome assembly RNA-binding protein YhbY [Clostridia bacterium]
MLTSKQRATLKSIAQKEDTIFQVGKGGISENLILQTADALRARELIKLRVLDTALTNAQDIAKELAEKTDSEVVQVIGFKIILFKKSKENKYKL